MTDKQLRHIDAAISGDKALTYYNDLFGSDAPLMARQAKLQTSIASCTDHHKGQKRNLGYRTKTEKDLEVLEGRAWAVAKITHEYAKDIGDSTLEHRVDFNKTDFMAGSIQEIKDNAGIVYDAVKGTVVAAMVAAGYRITVGDVTALQTAITTLESDMGMPKTDVAVTKAATEALQKEIHDTLDPTMDSIVDYITPYALTDLEEYNAVVDSFDIPEIGKRKIALWVRVSDSADHTRYKNAHVEVGGPEVKLGKDMGKMSSKRGIAVYSHEELIEGNCTVTVFLKGCGVRTFTNVAIFNDRMTLLDVQLVVGGADQTTDWTQGKGVIN